MHSAAVIPHHQIELIPFVAIDKLTLRSVLDQFADEDHGFGARHAVHCTDVRGEID